MGLSGGRIVRVRVLRRPIKPRNSLTGLTGVLFYRATAETPIHVGGGGVLKSISREELTGLSRNIQEIAKTSRDLGEVERIVKEFFSRPVGKEESVGSMFRLSGRLAIPGTTLKGVVRSRLEFMLRPDGRGEVPSCFSVSGGRPFVAIEGRHGWRHQRVYPASLEDRGPPCNAIKFSTVCDVCNIFGAPGLASRVSFGPLVFDSTPEVIHTPDGGFEALPMGSTAAGWISFRGLDPGELGLVLLGLGIGDGPILVGRWRYRPVDGTWLASLRTEVTNHLFHECSTDALGEFGEAASDPGKLAEALVERARKEYSRWLRELREDEVRRSL